MQPGENIISEAKENKALIIIMRLLYDISRNHREHSSAFLFRLILTEISSTEFSVNYNACLGGNYISLMCFMLAWLMHIYTCLNFLMRKGFGTAQEPILLVPFNLHLNVIASTKRGFFVQRARHRTRPKMSEIRFWHCNLDPLEGW